MKTNIGPGPTGSLAERTLRRERLGGFRTEPPAFAEVVGVGLGAMMAASLLAGLAGRVACEL